jgi:hypothetical protein
MTTRFWIFYRDGFVRLKLTEDRPLTFGYGGPTNEGWSSFGERYWIEDGTVYRETVEDGRDCDGRMTYTRLTRCPFADLKKRQDVAEAPGGFPSWETISAGQRDEYAEAMGY